MPTKKIADLEDPTKIWSRKIPLCEDPEHNPPTHMVFEPGVYEHTCPRCGAKRTFTVHRSMYGTC